MTLQMSQAIAKHYDLRGNYTAARCDKLCSRRPGRGKKSDYVIDIYLDRMKVLQNARREKLFAEQFLLGRQIDFKLLHGWLHVLTSCFALSDTHTHAHKHALSLAFKHTQIRSLTCTHSCRHTPSAICLVHDQRSEQRHPPSLMPPPCLTHFSLSPSLRLHSVCLPACTTLSKNIIPQQNGNTKETWAQSYKRTDTADNASSHPFPPIPVPLPPQQP